MAESQAAVASGSTDTAVLLAAEAAKFASRSKLIDASAVTPALVNALQENPRLAGQLRGLAGPIIAVTLAPDDSYAAAIASDGRVGIWRFCQRQLLTTFATPTSGNITLPVGIPFINTTPSRSPEPATLTLTEPLRAAPS